MARHEIAVTEAAAASARAKLSRQAEVPAASARARELGPVARPDDLLGFDPDAATRVLWKQVLILAAFVLGIGAIVTGLINDSWLSRLLERGPAPVVLPLVALAIPVLGVCGFVGAL